jgi:hypothetical protein
VFSIFAGSAENTRATRITIFSSTRNSSRASLLPKLETTFEVGARSSGQKKPPLAQITTLIVVNKTKCERFFQAREVGASKFERF